MGRYLVILEVSQKQTYIFGSNKVADNIVNSAIISKCLSPAYIKDVLLERFDENENLVYSGGGHTILEFDDKDKVRESVFTLTERIYKDYNGLTVFSKVCEYNNSDSPKENLKNLTAGLEKKKSLRRAGFHHGSFGIERLDVNTLKPETIDKPEAVYDVKREEYTASSKKFTPEKYAPVFEFEKLGGEKNKSNFIAVVHIDGNGMGKRVDELYAHIEKANDWDCVKKSLRRFSESIDDDFKEAYREMINEVAISIESGNLKDKLNLKMDKESNKPFFPVRRVITAGDDICFVTEGRIGIECARIFIEKLSQKINKEDGKKYASCAGIAIVHQKYPFYRAYELAEKLCSNAKKENALLSRKDEGRNVSSIDWHIEFGEVMDSIEDIRKGYISDDGSILTQKPYVIMAEKEDLIIQTERQYSFFSKNMAEISSCDYGNGIIKQLRSVMKRGAVETDNYIRFHKLKDKLNVSFYRDESDGRNKNTLFDAIEMMDTFLSV